VSETLSIKPSPILKVSEILSIKPPPILNDLELYERDVEKYGVEYADYQDKKRRRKRGEKV